MTGSRLSQYHSDPTVTGFNVTVADNIKVAREKRGMSRAQLAEVSGLKVRTIENAEDGRWGHSFYVMATLAAALRVPLGQFTAVNEA